jgi:hypothetical protein
VFRNIGPIYYCDNCYAVPQAHSVRTSTVISRVVCVPAETLILFQFPVFLCHGNSFCCVSGRLFKSSIPKLSRLDDTAS